MHDKKEEIFVKGKTISVGRLLLGSGDVMSVTGRVIRTGRMRNELYEDLLAPESLIAEIKKLPNKPDIFTFWQRPPATQKMIYDDRLAHPVLRISKMAHRDKKTDDALTANVVRACERRGIKFLTYVPWRRGSHADFPRRHRFDRMLLPRYYVLLRPRGWLVLKLKLHRGIRFFDLRRWWYDTVDSRRSPRETTGAL